MQIHTGLLSIVGFVSLLASAQAASSFDGTYQVSSATTVNKTFMSPGGGTMGQCPDRKPGAFTVANGMAGYTTETGVTLSGRVSPNGQFEMQVVQGGGSGPLKVMGAIDGNGKASVRQMGNSCSYDFVWQKQ